MLSSKRRGDILENKIIRIGGGQGFWGDSPDAAIDMVKNGNLNYLSCDYLAELTMSILQRQKNKNPQAGFARDFVSLFDSVAEDASEQGVKIITNAGGVNVEGIVESLSEVVKNKKINNYKIGYVTGDSLLEKIPKLMADGYEFINSDDGRKLSEIKDKILNANVYFGHEPIVEALEMGADVVVTGRAADSAMFLAPLAHEFKWKDNDWDNMAKGIMVGHMLECGGQGAGGNFDYDWRSVQDMDNLGFPIAEVSQDELFITKTETSGGLVSPQSVKEQILYEVHDPSNYITPDVVADISKISVDSVGKDRVKVAGIKGKERPENLKLTLGYHAGYKVECYLAYAWPDAYEKAKYASEIILKKMKRKGMNIKEVQVDFIGLNSLHLSVANMSEEHIKNLNEVMMRISVRTDTKEDAKLIIPEIAPLQLNGPPGSAFFGGRSKIKDLVALWPTFIPRELVDLKSHIKEVK